MLHLLLLAHMAKVSLYLDRRNMTSEGYPLKLRITHKNTNASRNTGIFLRDEEWDEDILRCTKACKRFGQKNEELDELIVNTRIHIKELEERGKLRFMKAADIFGHIEGVYADTNKGSDNSFNGILKEYAELCRKKNTADTFFYTETVVMAYVHTFAPRADKIFIQDMDYDFIFNLERWMSSAAAANAMHKSLKINSRAQILTNIRTLWNHAIRKKVAKKDEYPFGVGGFKIRRAQKKKVSLPLEDMHKLLALNFDQVEGRVGLETARDFFMLSFYLCGISPIDLFYLEKAEDGWVKYVRHKMEWTEPVDVEVKVIPEAQRIISKYEGKGKYLLSFPDKYANFESFYSFMRHRLDRIGIMIGQPAITPYWSRYTWSTFAARLQSPQYIIDKLMGHAPDSVLAKDYLDLTREDCTPVQIKVTEYALQNAHTNTVSAPKFIHKRGNKSELTEVF